MKHLKYFVDIILEKSIGSESIRLKYYSNIDKKLFYKIVNLDPTSIRKEKFSKPGKYSKWLLLQSKKANISQELLNDDSFYKKLNYYLFIFSTGWYKSKTKNIYYEYPNQESNDYLTVTQYISYTFNDITKFKSVSDFIKHMEKYVKIYELETEKSKFDIVYSDDKLDVLVPLNFSASYETAKNTDWCSQSQIGFSTWNNRHILFRIIPKDKEYDRVKLTWRIDNWFMATIKYPEITTLHYPEFKNKKPFDKIDGVEVWKKMIQKEREKDVDRWVIIWDKLESTLNLLSDKAKSTINEYWERNILNKQS